MKTVIFLCIGFLIGMLFLHYIWMKKILPWLSFWVQVMEHDWRHRTARKRAGK